MAETVNTREIILNILMDIAESGQPMHYVMSAWLMKYQYLEQQERRFITRVVRTTLEHEMWIDAMLNQYSSVKVKKMKPVIRNIMRMIEARHDDVIRAWLKYFGEIRYFC